VEGRFVEGRLVEGHFVGRMFCSEGRFMEGLFVPAPSIHLYKLFYQGTVSVRRRIVKTCLFTVAASQPYLSMGGGVTAEYGPWVFLSGRLPNQIFLSPQGWSSCRCTDLVSIDFSAEKVAKYQLL
jgi:hypothetical protein